MYRGSVARIIAGRGGLDGNINNFQKPITALERAFNIRFDGYTWKRAPALTSFEDSTLSGTPTCLAGYDWRPSSSVQRQITVWNDGNIYKEVSGDIDSVTLSTGNSFSNTVTILEARDGGSTASKELYIFGEGFTPKKLTGDGSSLSAITGESADWSSNKPASAIYHDYQTYAFGVSSAPHNIYISDITDNGDFSGGTSKVFEVYPGIGDKIVAGITYRPQELLLFKYPVGIIAIDTTDLTNTYLTSNVVSEEVGMAGPHAVVKVGGDIWFVSSNGRLYSLRAVRPDLDPIDADITAKLNLTQFITDFVDVNNLQTARLIYDEYRKELTYSFKSKDSDTNNMAIVLDLNEPGNPKVAIENRGEYFNAMWKQIDSTGDTIILTAGATGRVYECNAIGNSIDGVAFTTEFETVATDLSYTDSRLEGRIKRFDQLEVNYIPEGDVDIDIDVIIDGRLVKNFSINLSGDGAQFDSAVFDEDVFAGQTSLRRRFDIDLCGDQIAIRVSATGVDEDFLITQFRVFYQVLGKLGEI